MEIKKEKTENILTGLHKEMNRCRELKKEYDMIPEGFFGATAIQQSIDSAEKAIEEGDVVHMVIAYKDLQDCTG